MLKAMIVSGLTVAALGAGISYGTSPSEATTVASAHAGHAQFNACVDALISAYGAGKSPTMRNPDVRHNCDARAGLTTKQWHRAENIANRATS